MQPATRYVSNINRVMQKDEKFDLHLNEYAEDEDAASTGWTWVAAILIGGVLIVSGYLDQESRSFERGVATAADHRGSVYRNASLAVPAATKSATMPSQKGY